MANEKGGVDNITVVVVDIVDPADLREETVEVATETVVAAGEKA